MSKIFDKSAIYQILDELPISAGLYWQLRRQILPPREGHYWRQFQLHLPEWVAEAEQLRQLHTQHPHTSQALAHLR